MKTEIIGYTKTHRDMKLKFMRSGICKTGNSYMNRKYKDSECSHEQKQPVVVCLSISEKRVTAYITAKNG